VYTQCSKCETVFKLSADVLRAAGGQVRCGKCGEVFSALARLAEDSSAFAAGESPLELETRADRILESAVVLQVAQTVAKDYEEYAPPGVEIAQLEVLDWSEYDQADHQDSEDADQPPTVRWSSRFPPANWIGFSSNPRRALRSQCRKLNLKLSHQLNRGPNRAPNRKVHRRPRRRPHYPRRHRRPRRRQRLLWLSANPSRLPNQ